VGAFSRCSELIGFSRKCDHSLWEPQRTACCALLATPRLISSTSQNRSSPSHFCVQNSHGLLAGSMPSAPQPNRGASVPAATPRVGTDPSPLRGREVLDRGAHRVIAARIGAKALFVDCVFPSAVLVMTMTRAQILKSRSLRLTNSASPPLHSVQT